ncbi:ribosomal L1 domain-containing protein 1-like [Oncorhynchus clarkii lewisi]|uniref:ribosomal L1 domain-containing protein 1-like n=1 Tax=Oncorhynchus clarkii lewisi TaxID=490388 RepID=UPI0039B8CB7A
MTIIDETQKQTRAAMDAKVILYKTLRTEYKPFEAKRRLLGNFDMFLSDDRIRRLLSSHIGKHFYERKKEPLSLNLQSKKLALDIQGTTTTSISKKGCYCMAYVAHSGMAADELAENIDSAVSTIVTKLRKGPLIKVIHLKSQSVALTIYTSNLSNMTIIDETQKQTRAAMDAKVIIYKTLRTEYKPFEAKRRLLGNFDMFLSDDRIRRLLSSHIGKHFYERKKEPLSLNLQSKKLALDIQGTTTTSISKKGCYCMAYVAHSGMAADELAENIDSAVSTIVTKLRVRKDR